MTNELSEGFHLLQDAGPLELRKREEASGEDLADLSEVQIKQETQKEGVVLLTRGRCATEMKQHGALQQSRHPPRQGHPGGFNPDAIV